MSRRSECKDSVALVIRPRTAAADSCMCCSLFPGVPSQMPWARDPESHDTSRSVLLDLHGMHEWQLPSIMHPKETSPELSLDDDMTVQCLPVPKPTTPQWSFRNAPNTSTIRDYSRIPNWCRKPKAFTYHSYAVSPQQKQVSFLHCLIGTRASSR